MKTNNIEGNASTQFVIIFGQIGMFRSNPICLHSVYYNVINYIITQ